MMLATRDQSALIEDLQAENAWLKDMLGLTPDVARFNRLRQCGFQPAPARVALALLSRNGRPASYASLAECVPAKDHASDRDDYRVIIVYARHVRRFLGNDALQTIHGVGYRLTEIGADKLRALLGSLAP